MDKNVGKLDSYIRLSAGSFLLAYGASKKSPWLMAMGSCKVAEGITRWCPMFKMLGISTAKNYEDDMLTP